MKTRRCKIEDGRRSARSVLECGSPLPLFPSTGLVRPDESARGLAQPKTWRIAGARDSSRFTARFAAGFRGWPASPKFPARSGLKSALLRALTFCFLFSAFCFPAWGQYSIDWFTVDGGGGTSTGGVYSVTGTIGQPDAGGPMTGGNYSLTGGFWALYAVQTPGAPLLTITLNPQLSTITISWPSPSTGWNLQQNTNSISSLNWSNVTSGIQDDGTTKTLIVNPPTGNRFYRLQKP